LIAHADEVGRGRAVSPPLSRIFAPPPNAAFPLVTPTTIMITTLVDAGSCACATRPWRFSISARPMK
jgi:hypothetical protein